MTSPGAKMHSPGWVPLPNSPSSASSRSPIQDDGVNKRVETLVRRNEWFYGGRLRYKSPPKSPVLKKIEVETSNDTPWSGPRSGRIVPESPPPKSPVLKKIKMETSNDTPWSGPGSGRICDRIGSTGIKIETDDDDFTPRCTMQRTFKVQQEHLRSLSYDTHEWESLAAMLSPPHKVLPSTRNLLPPNPLSHNHFERPKNAYTRCLCISCVGPAKAKPQVAACAVCATQIPYSVCVASNRKPTTTTVPTMCFACVHAFV